MKYAGTPMGMWVLSAARADTITRYLFCCSMSGGLLDRTAHHRSDLINGIALTPVQTIFFHGKQFLTELQHFFPAVVGSMSMTTKSPSPFLVRKIGSEVFRHRSAISL